MNGHTGANRLAALAMITSPPWSEEGQQGPSENLMG